MTGSDPDTVWLQQRSLSYVPRLHRRFLCEPFPVCSLPASEEVSVPAALCADPLNGAGRMQAVLLLEEEKIAVML